MINPVSKIDKINMIRLWISLRAQPNPPPKTKTRPKLNRSKNPKIWAKTREIWQTMGNQNKKEAKHKQGKVKVKPPRWIRTLQHQVVRVSLSHKMLKWRIKPWKVIVLKQLQKGSTEEIVQWRIHRRIWNLQALLHGTRLIKHLNKINPKLEISNRRGAKIRSSANPNKRVINLKTSSKETTTQ